MRALLVVNPAATTTSPQMRDVISAALASHCTLEVAGTGGRGDATTLAAQAADDGVDLVVALGGDGTINEVVNGLMHAWPHTLPPALAILPGGHTNVLARSLGLPRDPVAATSRLLHALATGSRRRIGLGQADERWFTFCAGLGIDAAVVARIERARAAGHRVHTRRYVAAALAEFTTGVWHRDGDLELTADGSTEPSRAHAALITNTAPWTYLGPRPVNPCPQASFDAGLALFARPSAGMVRTLRTVASMLSDGGTDRCAARGGRTWHDLDVLHVRGLRPLPFQVDGEYAGARDNVWARAVPDCLDLVV
jgi:diacylglycerol kinase family enzyme